MKNFKYAVLFAMSLFSSQIFADTLVPLVLCAAGEPSQAKDEINARIKETATGNVIVSVTAPVIHVLTASYAMICVTATPMEMPNIIHPTGIPPKAS